MFCNIKKTHIIHLGDPIKFPCGFTLSLTPVLTLTSIATLNRISVLTLACVATLYAVTSVTTRWITFTCSVFQAEMTVI